ncbi:hypothetical protein QBC44DRAFT_323536 [Cladorrhinum sp. PSN332]|nr:hypothetical protein QBC44DRAFT_323536 [Cladorrhinum sp. PSN332]
MGYMNGFVLVYCVVSLGCLGVKRLFTHPVQDRAYLIFFLFSGFSDVCVCVCVCVYLHMCDAMAACRLRNGGRDA